MRTKTPEWQKSMIIVAHTACVAYCSLICQFQNYTALWTVYHSVQIIEFKNLISPIERNLIDWFVNRFNESDSFVYESAVCSVFYVKKRLKVMLIH